MFWKKKEKAEETPKESSKQEKLPGPKEIPELIGRYTVVQLKKDPDWVWKQKAVCREGVLDNKKVTFCRVFDEAEATKKGIKVKNYLSLDEHPELIMYEGWFDKKTVTSYVEQKRPNAGPSISAT